MTSITGPGRVHSRPEGHALRANEREVARLQRRLASVVKRELAA
jgi:hypothetical protein